MAPAQMSAFSEIFLATMEEIRTLTNATNYLPSKDAAYNLIQASIEKAASSLGEVYANAIDERGLSHNERLRLVELYGSLDGITLAKGVLKIILDSEVQKSNGDGTGEQCDARGIQVRQCLLDIWRCLQDDKLDKNKIEKAALLALFTQGRAAEKDDAQSQVPAWSAPLASILFPDRSLGYSDLSVTHNLARGILVVRSESSTTDMDGSSLEVELRRVTSIEHSSSERHIRLRYRGVGDGIFDFRMNSAVGGGQFMDRLRLISPGDCKIVEVGDLPSQIESREKSLRRKRGFEAISD